MCKSHPQKNRYTRPVKEFSKLYPTFLFFLKVFECDFCLLLSGKPFYFYFSLQTRPWINKQMSKKQKIKHKYGRSQCLQFKINILFYGMFGLIISVACLFSLRKKMFLGSSPGNLWPPADTLGKGGRRSDVQSSPHADVHTRKHSHVCILLK